MAPSKIRAPAEADGRSRRTQGGSPAKMSVLAEGQELASNTLPVASRMAGRDELRNNILSQDFADLRSINTMSSTEGSVLAQLGFAIGAVSWA
jgi:hypothetical protein